MPFSANSTCQVTAHAETEQPASALTDQGTGERDRSVYYCRERATRDASSVAGGNSFSHQSPVPASGVVVVVFVTGLSLNSYQGARIAFPSSERV